MVPSDTNVIVTDNVSINDKRERDLTRNVLASKSDHCTVFTSQGFVVYSHCGEVFFTETSIFSSHQYYSR